MKRVFLLVLLTLALWCAAAAEFERGALRLVLDEHNGRFLLYSKGADSQYRPLLFDRDPRTSFLSVLVNDRAYKLGDSSSFSVRLVADAEKPSFVFESAQLIIREEFAFINSAGSDVENGVEITVTVESKAASVNAGFRLLLDTFLGESGSSPHFYIDSRTVSGETLAAGSGAVWVSKNSGGSLMGSIMTPGGEGPDSVLFANWKRLTDATWKAPFESGRNFNAPPYSIQDSAVCYYVEPRALERGNSFSAVILLSTEDPGGFAPAPELAAVPDEPLPVVETPPAAAPVAAAPVVEDQRAADLAVINDMLRRLDEYIAAGTVTEEELAAMEQTLDRFSLKYGIGPGTYR